MARVVTIAVCQFGVRPVKDFDEFAGHVRRVLDRAVGADLVILPELFTLELFTTFPDWRRTPITELGRIDEYTQDYRMLFMEEARSRDQYIAAGTHLVGEAGKLRNMAHLFEPGGTMHTHSKTHVTPTESEWSTSEANTMDIIELPFAKVGFNIGYETEIPECAATLAHQGAEIILGPSFTFSEFGFWRVRHCAEARCIENQIYFIHCCNSGRPGAPLPESWAQSAIMSPCDGPWGPSGRIAQAKLNQETIIFGAIDLDRLHENRRTGAAPTFRDRRRRAELYARWPSHVPVLA